MIRLTKAQEPQELAENGEAWREEYARLLSGDAGVPDAARYRYKAEAIKDALRVETRDKCAYCESRVLHVSPEHIEHILPKRHRPDLVVTWTNLTLACPQCNIAKSDYFDPAEPLLNPYLDDPAEHLLFVGGLVLQRPASDLGIRSIEIIQLSRPGLVERRQERVRLLHPLVDVWARVPAGPTKEALARQLAREAAPDAEYAAAVRSYLLQLALPR